MSKRNIQLYCFKAELSFERRHSLRRLLYERLKGFKMLPITALSDHMDFEGYQHLSRAMSKIMWDFNCSLNNQQINYNTHFCENLFIALSGFEALVTLATFQLNSPSRGDFICADTSFPNVKQTKKTHVFLESSLYSACRSKIPREFLFLAFPRRDSIPLTLLITYDRYKCVSL